MENVLLIILVILLAALAVWRLFFYVPKNSPKPDEELEQNILDEEETSVDTLIRDITVILNQRLRSNLWDKNLSLEELTKKKRDLKKLRYELDNAPYGEYKARQGLKQRISTILTSREYGYCLDNVKALTKIVNFTDARQMTYEQIHETILYLYSKKYNEEAFDHLIEDFDLCRYVKGSDGRDYYRISKEAIKETLYAIMAGRSTLGKVSLSERDMLEIIVQLIYSNYKGLGAIDSLYYQHLDEIDCGVSGIPIGGFNIAVANRTGREIKQSYESIWVVYRGVNIALDYLGFKNNDDFIRVTDNIYGWNAAKELTQKDPYIVSTMTDGSRIAVCRPPLSENHAFFLRKFTAGAQAPEPVNLIRDQYNYIPINLLRWAIKAERNLIITGQAGSGKTTLLKAVIRYISTTLNIRVVELAFELSLRFVYPELNILTLQQTESASMTEIMNWLKKANSAVTILGEIASAEQSHLFIQTCQVNSRLGLATHHAGDTDELVAAIGEDLTQCGQYRDTNDAIAAAAKAININCKVGITNGGHRHIEFIDEIIPTSAIAWPSDEEYQNRSEMDKTCADARKYFRDSIHPKKYEIRRLCHWTDEGGEYHFVLDNLPSEMFFRSISDRSEELAEEFSYDMEMMTRTYNGEDTEEVNEWLQKIWTA